MTSPTLTEALRQANDLADEESSIDTSDELDSADLQCISAGLSDASGCTGMICEAFND